MWYLARSGKDAADRVDEVPESFFQRVALRDAPRGGQVLGYPSPVHRVGVHAHHGRRFCGHDGKYPATNSSRIGSYSAVNVSSIRR